MVLILDPLGPWFRQSELFLWYLWTYTMGKRDSSEEPRFGCKKRNHEAHVDYLIKLIQKRQFRTTPSSSLSPTTLLPLEHPSPSSPSGGVPKLLFLFHPLLLFYPGIPSHAFHPFPAGLRARYNSRRDSTWLHCRSGRHLSLSHDGPYPYRDTPFPTPFSRPP